MEQRSIDIPWKTIFKIILAVLAVVFLYFVKDVLAILFLAVIISSAVIPGSHKLVSSFRVPRILAVIFIYIFGIALFSLFIYIVVPKLFGDIKFFIENMPAIISKLSKVFEDFSGFPLGTIFEVPVNIQDLIFKATDIFGRTLVGFAMTVGAFLGTTASVFSVLALSFYLSIQEKGMESIVKLFFPSQHHEYIMNLQDRVQKKIGRWLIGQVVLGTIIGILVFVGLTILGVHYALILAVIAALLELVPVAGPIVAAVPSIIIALLQDPLLGLATFLFYIIIQQIENHFVVPTVMRRAVGLNPVLVLVSLLIGFNLGGIIGMVLAVPFAVTFLEVLSDINQKKDLAGKL